MISLQHTGASLATPVRVETETGIENMQTVEASSVYTQELQVHPCFRQGVGFSLMHVAVGQ